MSQQIINLSSLPTTAKVAVDLRKIFSSDEVDLCDVIEIAFQDPVVLTNIIILVNKSIQKMDRPVVNTLSAAINLLGISALSETLLAIKNIDELNLSTQQNLAFNIIRNRICVAAHMTRFWAEYMGEVNAEEQFCASMFTGINDLFSYVIENHGERPEYEASYLDSIEAMKSLYLFDEVTLMRLPDSIQQIYMQSSHTRRLSLSVLCYELVSALELGYSSVEFNKKLALAVECFDQSVSRAAYDFSIQLIELEKKSTYKSYCHAHFLVGENTDSVDPFDWASK